MLHFSRRELEQIKKLAERDPISCSKVLDKIKKELQPQKPSLHQILSEKDDLLVHNFSDSAVAVNNLT